MRKNDGMKKTYGVIFFLCAVVGVVSSTQAMYIQWQKLYKNDEPKSVFEHCRRSGLFVDGAAKLNVVFYKAGDHGAVREVLLKDYNGWGVFWGSVNHFASDSCGELAKVFGCTKWQASLLWHGCLTGLIIEFADWGMPVKFMLFIRVPDNAVLGKDYFGYKGEPDRLQWFSRDDLFLRRDAVLGEQVDPFLAPTLDFYPVKNFLVCCHS